MAQNNDIEQLFKRNYAAMHRLAAMMLHDDESAHDVVHDIFAALVDKGEGRRGDSSADEPSISISASFLMRSVRNSCLNRLRSLSVRERFASLYVQDEENSDNEEPWPDEETYRQMQTCINGLPPRCREVFNLRFREGMDSAQIEQRLGIGERAVYKHLRNAIDTLRSKLTRDGKN